ncbi:MAG: hypothetical protein ACI4GW_00955 [Lachnospiraceae bacterium]
MRNYKIIAVDFDGTLCYSKWPDLGAPNIELVSFLCDWKAKGNKLILWTCRSGELLEAALKWSRIQGIEYDAVNDNLPEIIEEYGCNSRKVSADYYLDDRALSWKDGINKCHRKR